MKKQSLAFKYFLILIAVLVLQASSQSLSLTVQTPTINTNSLYTFQLFDEQLKDYDGIIKLTFPSTDYPSLTTVTKVYTSGSPTSTYPFSSAGSVLSITYVRGSPPAKFISFVVDSVKNPGSVKSVTILYTFTNTTQLTSASVTYGSFATGSLSACSLTFNPSTTHTIGSATLAVTVTNTISSGGSITIGYPSSWNNPTTSSYPPVTSDSITCTKISGSLTNSISCLALSNSIDVTSVFSSTISALGSFSFSMSNIRSPPTTSSANKITVTTVSSTGNQIDKSTTCSVNAVSAQTLTISTTSTFTVGETQELKLSWITNSPLTIGDNIKITIPTNYMSFQSLTTMLIFSGNSIIFFSTASVTTAEIRTFTIDTLPSGLTEISAGTTISIEGIYVKTLIDTSPRNIQIDILRNSFNVATGTIQVTPTSNSLSSVALSSDLQVVSNPMTFKILFTTKNSLKADGTLSIIFPSTIQYVSAATPSCSMASTTSSSSVPGSASCSFNSGLLKLTVSGFLSSQISGSTVLQLTITGFLANPLTTQPTSSFSISTVSAAGYTIDRSSDKTYSATAGTIGSLTISRASTVVGSSNIYTFLYTLTRTIKLGAEIIITLPSQISLSTSPSYSYSINGGSVNSITPTISTDGNGKKTISFVGMVTANLVATNTMSIKITNLINPLSLRPSSSFGVASKHSGYAIESISSGLVITNTQMSSFQSVVQAVFQPMNGENQDYNFYIKPLIPLYATYKLYIDLIDATSGINELSFSNPITGCRIYKGISTLENTCSLVGSRLTVTLVANMEDVSGATEYQLVVSKVKMGRTMAPTSTVKLSAYTNDGYGISQTSLTGIQTTFENKIQVLSLSISTSPSQLNQAQSFTVSFTTFNGLYMLQGDYAVITIPQSYSYVGGPSPTSICTNTLYLCSFYNGDDHSIKIKPSGSFTSVAIKNEFSITFAIGLYTSPTTFLYTNDYFYVTTYTSSDSVIDQTLPNDTSTTAAATFYRACGGFCKTCLSSNTSHCITCYDPVGTLTFDGYNYLTSDNNCVDACGDNYYNNSGICTPCSDPCYGCDLHELDCTSCVSGYFFDSTETAENSSCKITCPDRYYGDSTTNRCKLCSALCAQCDGSSVLCTACDPGKYLYNSECKISCPDGFYEDTSSNECVSCDISCDGCNTNATDCQVCANNYYASVSGCVSDCPYGTVKNPSTTQCECLGECETCAVQLTQCLSCTNSSKVLYEFSCLSGCPSGSYLPVSETQCTDCLFQFCSKCSQSQCLLCESGYYLHLGGCVQNCPNSYYQSANLCEDCGNGCALCDDGIQCLSCSSPYLKEQLNCVLTCSSSYINFNATKCVDVCPIGYNEISGKCQRDENSSSSSTTIIEEQTTTAKIIPFPYTIAFCLISLVCIAMKWIYSPTMLPSAIMSFGSILQILSAITFIIASYVEFGGLRTTVLIVLLALGANYVLNIFCIVFIVKILNNDKKFMTTYKKTVCSNIFVRALTVVFSHKFHEIVFSNIFAVRALSNKVQYVGKLLPFNILLIISLVITVVCIVGAGATSYSVQDLRMASTTFIWSVDCIIVWVLNFLATILVLRRKDKDYENYPDEEQAKRYETQDQFNFNNESCGVDDVFIEESRVNYPIQSKNGQSRKNYFYQNSSKSIGGEDPYETPLNRKKVNAKNPITTGKGQDLEESSQALCIGDKNKSKKKIDQDSNQDIEEIMLEEPVRDNLININKPGQNTSPNKQKNVKLNYEGYDLDPHLLQIPENSEEFKKLPAQTKSKIRLAKANMQINKNSKNLKNIRNQGAADQDQLDQIQLSPKKNGKGKGDQENSPRTEKKSNRKGVSKSKSKGKDGQNSISKSKSKEKNLVKTKQKGAQLSPNASPKHRGRDVTSNDEDIDLDMIAIEESNEDGMKRNRSEVVNKKNLRDENKAGTKSQHLKKKGNKINRTGDISVAYQNGEQTKKQFTRNKKNKSEDDLEEEEPSLPIFKHNGRRGERYGSESDGLEIIQENDVGEKGKGKKGHSKRRSQSTLERDKDTKNKLKGRDGINNQMAEQDRDQIPHMRASEQLESLVINRNNSTNKKSDALGFSNDDESIYNKIYKDETQTLKSVQGDNLFGQDVSPSQFNIQNQRFEDTDISSNDMPIKPFITHEFDEDGNMNLHRNDGFDDVPEIRRYGSTKNYLNIDYDLVRQKRQDNDRIKELQKIYLPRLEVRAPPPRKKK